RIFGSSIKTTSVFCDSSEARRLVKITLNWLRELVDVVLSPEELAETLVMAGLEVESIEERRPSWTQVEIAVVEQVAPHPNADRLRLCQVRRTTETVAV